MIFSLRRSAGLRTLPRRFCALLALVSYVAAAVGLPVPAASKGTPSFPCQHRHCGCMNPDDCRHDCACSGSLEETESTPERADTNSCASCTESEPAEADCACCQSNAADCCGENAQTDCPMCAKRHAAKKKLNPSDPDSSSWHWLLGESVHKCKGQSILWVTLGTVLPACCETVFVAPMPAIGSVVELNPILTPLPIIPPVPPPRPVV